MDLNSPSKYTLWKQSSLAPDSGHEHLLDLVEDREDSDIEDINIDPGFKLMYLVNEGDVDGIRELLESGNDVNFRDIDHRTALHVAACQGYYDVAQLLLDKGADVQAKDRWGSTPLADAIHYKMQDVIKLLEKCGAKGLSSMHVENAREVPEYEINPEEIDCTNSVGITKGTYKKALWAGTEVAVKTVFEGIADEDKVKAFIDELSLLQKIRHPNVVQFLGAVTQSSPMMIVTEYLPKGDLHEYLKRGPVKPATALRFAMDIARGLNYLHEHKPEAIIHRDLEPSNILRDDMGHLKVADFGVSKLLIFSNGVKEEKLISCHETSCRYMAPEVFRNEEYGTKVDVFSFALILQEMIEGCQPFKSENDHDVPKHYLTKKRPPFKAPMKFYAHGLKELIQECWSEKPNDRPTFKQIIPRLEAIYNSFGHRRRWKVRTLKCFTNPEWKKDLSNAGSRTDSSSRAEGSI